MSEFYDIPSAIEELKKGNMLIVVDSPNRENQGDLIFPAETVTGAKVNFMMTQCRGMVCVPIIKETAVQLDLPLMVAPSDNTETTGVQFTVTVDSKHVKSFGVSASDRARTIKVLANLSSKPNDLVRPGHVFPLLARDGGILARAGHTEATIELARLSGYTPCGVLCEIIRDDGAVARIPELIPFSQNYSLPIVSIADLIEYVKKNQPPRFTGENLIKTASSILPTQYGTFHMTVYKSIIDNREHVALRMGNGISGKPILTRIHSQCLTGDTFLSLKCDCREQLYQSMNLIRQNKNGLIIYLNQEGRGIGLSNKIKAYGLQEKGLDTVEANQALHLPIDARDYQVAAEILHDLGISSINLLTNNPHKVAQLSLSGVTIIRRIPLEIPPNPINTGYLQTKKRKLGHLLNHI